MLLLSGLLFVAGCTVDDAEVVSLPTQRVIVSESAVLTATSSPTQPTQPTTMLPTTRPAQTPITATTIIGATAQPTNTTIALTPTVTITAVSSPTPTPTATLSTTSLTNLDAFQWENRLIVVFADPTQITNIADQFWAEDPAVIDRRILWFIVANDSVTTNYNGQLSSLLADNLRNRYARLDTLPEVVLIGLDTGVKNRQPFLDSAAIYGQIDLMPMRQQELQQRQQ